MRGQRRAKGLPNRRCKPTRIFLRREAAATMLEQLGISTKLRLDISFD